MKKTFKIIKLECKNTETNELWLYPTKDAQSSLPYHLYIISNDEIKEGDWYLDMTMKTSDYGVHQCKSERIAGITKKYSETTKKIVATTDKSLTLKSECTCTESEAIYCGESKSIGKCQQLLPQIPESFIQAYIKAYNEGNPITEVDLEMETFQTRLKQHNNRLGYVADCGVSLSKIIKTRPDNTVIVHQSKQITKDEMYLNMQYYYEHCLRYGYCTPQDWIEKHKHF